MKIYPCGFHHKKTFLENTKKYSCAEPFGKLEPNNLEVYLWNNSATLYGAIQKEKYDFYIPRRGQNDQFSFIHACLSPERSRLGTC